MRRSLGMIVVGALVAAPAVAQGPTLHSVPKVWGSYGPAGNCTRMPRVAITGSGVTLFTAAGTRSFPKAVPTWGFNGPDDTTLTIMVNGNGDGLIITIDDPQKPREMSFTGGAPWTPPEQAIATATLRKCAAK